MNRIPQSVRILVPAYNAAESLPALLSGLHEFVTPDSVCVIDDGSSDATSAVAERAGARVLIHRTNRGKGAALKTGIGETLRDPSAQAIVTIDSDGQHDPSDLPGLVDIWVRTQADLVIGNRRILGSKMPLHRRMSNVTTSYLVSLRTGIRIPDSQCGYRILSRKLAEHVTPLTDGFEAETEWIIRAAAAGLSVTSAPVRTVYTGTGSHMKNWETTKAFVQVLLKEYTWAD